MRGNYKINAGQTRRDLLKQIYLLQIRNSKKRGHPRPKYSENEFIGKSLTDPMFNFLYKQWEEGGYDPELRPSCDRILDTHGYSWDNIQWLTYRENLSKPKQLQQKRIALFGGSNTPIAVVFGLTNTAMLTGHSTESITKALKSGKPLNGIKFVEIPDESWKGVDTK